MEVGDGFEDHRVHYTLAVAIDVGLLFYGQVEDQRQKDNFALAKTSLVSHCTTHFYIIHCRNLSAYRMGSISCLFACIFDLDPFTFCFYQENETYQASSSRIHLLNKKALLHEQSLLCLFMNLT